MNGNIPPIPHSIGDATKYLDGTYNFSAPAGAGILRHLLIVPDGINTIPPSAPSSSSSSSGSRARDFLSMGAVGLDQIPGAANGLSIGTLIGYTNYNPGTDTTTSTSSTTGADVDATNLSVTFTVPPSGKVLVSLKAGAFQAGGVAYWWCLRDTSGNNISGTRGRISGATTHSAAVHRTIVSGLTPGTSVTYRWGHGASGASGSIRYGDDASTDPFGAALMEVWDAAPTVSNALSQSTAIFPTAAMVCGRLTTETGVPISTTDRTSQSTLYFTPYNGGSVSLFDGSSWNIYSFNEVSLALSGLTSGKNYDVFIYNNAGVMTLELSAAWTNDTTRADALALQNGLYVKSSATTRLWVGTIRTTSTTATEDSAAKRFVWNRFNQITRVMKNVTETTDNWAYNSATVRQANANAANQLDYVTGDAASFVEAMVHALATTSAYTYVGIGVDTTTVFTAGQYPAQLHTNGGVSIDAWWKGYPGLGRHFISWNESNPSGTSATYYGDAGVGSNLFQNGLFGTIWN